MNEHFTSANSQDCPDEKAARKLAITSALAIAAEHVTAENGFFGAEVTIESDETQIARFVVSAGASLLKA